MNLQPTDIYNIQEKRPKTSGNIWCSPTEITQQTTNFKVVTIPDTTTLKYYQSIYIYCKQRFNIPDGIEIVEKTLYQYIENHINNYLLGNYNISEVRNNLYNNLVHYSRLKTKDLNSKTLATYFQELNYNIIKYCEEKYPVQFKYSFDFKSETKTGNKGKQKVKQHSKTAPNTPILLKTTAKHLQTPKQGTSVKLPLSITLFLISLARPQTPNSLLNHFSRPEDFQLSRNLTQQQKPISTSTNIIKYLQKNESDHSENLESEETESEQGEATKNKEKMATAYIAKISEFTSEDNDTSPQEWLDKVQKAEDANRTAGKWFENLEEPFENWQAFKDAFLQQFTNNNISITLRNHFRNIKQETSETVMTYFGRFNKLLKRIRQLKTNNYYSNAQILDQFIAGLKNKLIKKVHPHAPADLATAIRHAKNYKMAIEEANHTKLVNLAIGKTSSAAEEKINQLTKKDTGNKIVGNYKETNKTEVINVTLYYNNLITNSHHQLIIHQDHKFKTAIINQLHNQFNNNISNFYQFSNFRHYSLNNINNNNRINSNNQLVLQNSGQQRPNHYHTQPSYLTIPEESDFQQTVLSKDEVALKLPKMPISNELLFLLSNAAVNEQKAITAIYTEATVERKPICLILDSRLTGNRPAQTVIVTADDMKKTLVGEIDDFAFTIDGITISIKVLVIDAPQYQALVRNDWLLKANANLNWETQELKISYQGQYTIVPATCTLVFEFEEEEKMPLTKTYMALESPSNWAEETEQEIFEESKG
ncbi:hypothetical protein G9A89_019333 [Geosiphon pyriformis]|nr:hypothetical protein G9A89_019333 [Geosiphon pyriformis]